MRPRADQQPGLEAAVREFATHGYEGASIDRIIDRSQMSRATFYKYFDGKLSAYLSAVSRVLVDYAKSLPDPASTHETVWAELLAEIRAGHRFAREDPSLVAFLHEGLRVARAHPEHPTAVAIVVGIRGRVGTWIERGRRLGAIRVDLAPDVLIDLVVAIIETLDDHFVLVGFVGPAHDDLADLYLDTVRRAIERDPRS